jgi:hypothetical protein
MWATSAIFKTLPKVCKQSPIGRIGQFAKSSHSDFRQRGQSKVLSSVTRFGEISSFGRIFFLELGAFFSEKVSPK